MVVTQDLEKNGEVTCYVFFFMVLTPQISRPTLNTFGPIPVYDRAVSEGIDHGASAHVIGFAKVLNPVDVTGDVEDLFFFDENGVALSRGLDWMAMPRRRPMAAEPVFRALRARGTLPQKID